MFGNVNQSGVITNPGAKSAFAPPADFVGTEREYRDLMRDRYKQRGYSQLIAVQAMQWNRGQQPAFIGPFAAAAMEIVQAIAAELNQQRPASKE